MPLPEPFPDADDVDLLIAESDGDARAALTTILREAEALRQELMIATRAMSFGFTRGWRPVDPADR